MLQRCLTGSLNSERSIAVKTFHSVSLFVLLTSASAVCAGETWPQAAGPNGSWTTETHHRVPTGWSGSTGQNILWAATLDEGGQSGIAVSGDRMFLTINKPLPTGRPSKRRRARTLLGSALMPQRAANCGRSSFPAGNRCLIQGYFRQHLTDTRDGRTACVVHKRGRSDRLLYGGRQTGLVTEVRDQNATQRQELRTNAVRQLADVCVHA